MRFPLHWEFTKNDTEINISKINITKITQKHNTDEYGGGGEWNNDDEKKNSIDDPKINKRKRKP